MKFDGVGLSEKSEAFGKKYQPVNNADTVAIIITGRVRPLVSVAALERIGGVGEDAFDSVQPRPPRTVEIIIHSREQDEIIILPIVFLAENLPDELTHGLYPLCNCQRAFPCLLIKPGCRQSKLLTIKLSRPWEVAVGDLLGSKVAITEAFR